VSAFLLKLAQSLVPWLVDKIATALYFFIKTKQKENDIAANQDAALDQLQKAKTKEEVENAAKNSLGL
jgi:hypothetical protein